MNHTQDVLYQQHVGARSHYASGPLAEFLAKKAAERAPKTFQWYQDSLLQLWSFLEERGAIRVGDFTEHLVNLFRIELRARGAKDNTVANRLRAIKAFARWMADTGWTEENPLARLPVPQSTKPQFDLIPDETRARLFALFPADTFLGSRNLAMLGVLSDTGLRREELVGLVLSNVDLGAGVLKVYADKTSDWRYLPLTDEVVALVRNHLRWRERYFAQVSRRRAVAGDDGKRRRAERRVQSDRLFLTAQGVDLQPQALGLILNRASKKLGVRLHPHLFRHDWITRKALDGESPSLVRRWAGHKSYAMTDYYFGLAEDMLGAIKPKRSVLATLNIKGLGPRIGARPKKVVT